MTTKKPVKPVPRAARNLRVLYLGNFQPEHSTESHLRIALLANGHDVTTIQESERSSYKEAAKALTEHSFDLLLWTRTRWGWHDEPQALKDQVALLRRAKGEGLPTVAYHLDRWWGLEREHMMHEDPYFGCDIVITADGGNEARFDGAGINHVWFPPGVSAAECERGTVLASYASPFAFVGSHDGGYHREHAHRHDLVAWLRKNHRRDCEFWPKPGQHAVRGQDLRDLYASVDVLVGDSCFAGTKHGNRYVSDRLPETLGRGGTLVHPHVPGVTDGSPWRFGPTWTAGEHLECWTAGDWDELEALLQQLSGDTRRRNDLADAGRAHTIEHHTYEVRMRQLVQLLEEEGKL